MPRRWRPRRRDERGEAALPEMVEGWIQAFWEWLAGDGPRTLFAGSITFIFGIIALVIGALLNAHLNRRRDDRLRKSEINAVAAALYGEVLLLRKDLARVANLAGQTHFEEGMRKNPSLKFNRHFLERVKLRDPALYPALASKLGLLPSSLVLAITKFHADYEEARSWLPLLIDDDDRGFSYSVLVHLNPAIEAVLGVQPALLDIEVMLGIAQPSKSPDLSAALQSKEIEDIHFQSP